MQITLAGIPLTFATTEGRPFDIKVNGRQLVQTVELPRALQLMALARGNAGTVFEFSVKRLFATRADADIFALTHQQSLPPSGQLYVQSDDGTQAAVLGNAALASVTCTVGGLTVAVGYSFQGGQFSETAPLILDTQTTYFPDLDLTVKKNLITLGAGAANQAVAFGTPFSGNPVVQVSLVPPAGQPAIGCWLNGAATINGFAVAFDAPTPVAGYVLQWIAFD